MNRRSEEHTSELQSQSNLVCRLLLEKKKKIQKNLRHGMRETTGCGRPRLCCSSRRDSSVVCNASRSSAACRPCAVSSAPPLDPSSQDVPSAPPAPFQP